MYSCPFLGNQVLRLLVSFHGGAGLLVVVVDGGVDEAEKEGIGVQHGRGVLGVVLGAEKPAFAGDLDHLHQPRVGVFSHAGHSGLLESLAVVVVELEAVAVTLADEGLAVGLGGQRAGTELTLVCPQAHRSSHVGDALLLLHEVDDVVGGRGVHLGGVGVGHAEHVAGELYDHALHAQADAQGRDVMLAGPL